MPPIIDKTRCNACGICVNVCPQDVFFESRKKEVPVITYPEECWHCNACVMDCPQEAVELRTPLPMSICYK